MNGLEATLSMSAGHEATRTALREALPQLGALLAQGGLQLGGAHVGDGSERNAGREARPGDRGSGAFGAGTGTEPVAVIVPTAAPGAPSTRLIDTFA
jgi:flagellar hook-length control protein FliK